MQTKVNTYLYSPKPEPPFSPSKIRPEEPPNQVVRYGTSWGEKVFWLVILAAAVAFVAGTEVGRRAERAENRARVAEFRAEQAQTAQVPYAK